MSSVGLSPARRRGGGAAASAQPHARVHHTSLRRHAARARRAALRRALLQPETARSLTRRGGGATRSERHELVGGGESLDPALDQPPKRGKEEMRGWVERGGVPQGVVGVFFCREDRWGLITSPSSILAVLHPTPKEPPVQGERGGRGPSPTVHLHHSRPSHKEKADTGLRGAHSPLPRGKAT